MSLLSQELQVQLIFLIYISALDLSESITAVNGIF